MELTSLEPPPNSRILFGQDDDGHPMLSWKPGVSTVGRWATAAFLGFWLCGWFAGEVAALGMLATMVAGILRDGGGAIAWGVGLFLLIWLAGWTTGGFWAARAFAILVQKPRPESLTFGPVLRYDPGSFLAIPTNGDMDRESARAFRLWRPPPVREIPWSELGPIRLERVGERQRLTVDWGAERIEIGATLREPEREWLAEILRAWAGQHS